MGSVDAADVSPPPFEGNKDDQTLIFKTFLAVPLLSTSGLYTERKFSGSDEAGDSVDETGRAIDAFAHHVLVDSHGSFLLADLQGSLFVVPLDDLDLLKYCRPCGTR